MLDDHILFKDNKIEAWLYWQDKKIDHDAQLMIAFDRIGLWDKLSKCPIRVGVPKNEKEMNELIKKVKWLKTKNGYKASEEYDTKLWMTKYKGDTSD